MDPQTTSLEDDLVTRGLLEKAKSRGPSLDPKPYNSSKPHICSGVLHAWAVHVGREYAGAVRAGAVHGGAATGPFSQKMTCESLCEG